MTPYRTERLVGLTLLACLGGCLGPRKDQYQSSATITATADTRERLWRSAQETLRDHRFELDRVDRSAGVITTKYVTSQSVFEFWRHDVDTREDLWESTLNPVRRRVEVDVVPAEQSATNRVSVAVYKQRISSPDRQFNSTGAVYQYFGEVLPSTTGQERVTAADERWVDIGRDPAMEQYLLNSILNGAGVASSAATGG